MLLARLKEYADEQMGDQHPPLYASTPVAWVVTIDPDGRALSPHPTSRFGEGTRGKRGQEMIAPEVGRSSGIKPLLLADNGEYTFGKAQNPTKQDRADKAHAAYRELLRRCVAETGEPAVRAVQRFYERGGAAQLDLGEDWDYKLKVAFVVRSENGAWCNPIDLPTVQRFWLSANEPDPDTTGQCLVCGEHRPVLDRLQTKIKGVRGGQSAGTALVSANSDAFESYGLQASRTAPTCRECGEAFTRAANHLLAGERTSLRVGNTTFVFWTRHETAEGFDLGSLIRDPDSEAVRALIDSPRKGHRTIIEDGTAFYAAALSASGGRTVVRDWIDTTVGSVAQSAARWFDLQRVTNPRDEDPTGQHPQPLSLFRLAVSTVRKPADLPVTTVRSLFRTALTGTPLPMDIAFQAVRRNRAEQGVRQERAALIKLVLLSRGTPTPKEKNYMVALESKHPEPAYHCGRLLAVIERIQYAALGRVNATVVDRYYGAASSTPAVVFGSLLRGAQPHLAKLADRRRAGLQNHLMEVCDQITGFPKTLTLEQQALFSLGYYHQKAHDRAVAISRRSAATTTQPNQVPTDH